MGKPTRKVNSDRVNANIFGFYAMNGNSVATFPEMSKGPDMCSFLDEVRTANGSRKVVMILDNGRIHHTDIVTARATELDIVLVFLPPYSPQFNPIEIVWKTIKARISGMFLRTATIWSRPSEIRLWPRQPNPVMLRHGREDFLMDHDSK